MKSIYLSLLMLLCSYSIQAQIADSLQRKVALQGTVNFRDVGGYATKDGKKVKWGQVYRSADISRLTDQDLQKLQSLKLALVCDLRGPAEIKTSPDRLPTGAEYLNLPAGSETLPTSANYAQMNTDSLILSIYSSTTYLKAKYKPLLEKMVDLPENNSMMFHCTAGKDRTGIGAAILLSALGVSREMVVADYLATNYYWRPAQQKMIAMMVKSGMNESKANALLGAHQLYIETFLDTITKQYGSMDLFLEQELGLDQLKRAKLQKRFLE